MAFHRKQTRPKPKKAKKQPSRKVNAQTRVKLSQSAKKRHRTPKGGFGGGRFASGATGLRRIDTSRVTRGIPMPGFVKVGGEDEGAGEGSQAERIRLTREKREKSLTPAQRKKLEKLEDRRQGVGQEGRPGYEPGTRKLMRQGEKLPTHKAPPGEIDPSETTAAGDYAESPFQTKFDEDTPTAGRGGGRPVSQIGQETRVEQGSSPRAHAALNFQRSLKSLGEKRPIDASEENFDIAKSHALDLVEQRYGGEIAQQLETDRTLWGTLTAKERKKALSLDPRVSESFETEDHRTRIRKEPFYPTQGGNAGTLDRSLQEQLWRHEGGYIPTPSGGLGTGATGPVKSPKLVWTIGEAKDRVPAEVKDEVNRAKKDPNSPLFTGGQKGEKTAERRERVFYNLMLGDEKGQNQRSYEDAMRYLGTEQRGQARRTVTRTEALSAQKDIRKKRTYPGELGVKGKGEVQPKDVKRTVEVPSTDTKKDLKKRFGDEKSDADLVKYRHMQREAIFNDVLERNQRWAHEERSARMRGKTGSEAGQEDRVVFFTTNLGAPAPSVPAGSAIGQYIIKKRKRAVVDDKLAPRSAVTGKFPEAVRDQHLMEVSTGIGVGVEGRAGVFHRTGWRKGSKRSPGYKKSIPVGTEILRDSLGRPVFDKDGNIKYTEGYTRPFSLGTTRDVGLKIFLG